MTDKIVINGVLTRRVPRRADEEHLDLDSLPTGWFAISHHWIESIATRRQDRGCWYSIESPESGGCVFRVLRLEPTLRFDAGSDKVPAAGEIWIDWDAWLELAGRVKDVPDSMKLRVRKARFWQTARLAEKHPDPAYRLAVRLAWILGLLSVFVSIAPRMFHALKTPIEWLIQWLTGR